MNLFKKRLTYFKFIPKNVNFKATIYFLLMSVFITILCFYLIEIYNREKVYENIKTILVGDDVKVALKKMSKNTFVLEYIIEPCDRCFEHDLFFTYEIEYSYKDYNDPLSQYPRIYFDTRTNKVIDVWNGFYY